MLPSQVKSVRVCREMLKRRLKEEVKMCKLVR